MASFQFQPPGAFDFKYPTEWERWIRRFERYREVSDLIKEDETRQVTTLIYCLGEDAEDILQAANLTTEDKTKNYKAVVEVFQKFCIGKKNTIYERARFNSRKQGEEEPIELFVTNLCKLAETCEFGALKEELIRDRLVIGIKDCALSETLQLDPNLTLETAIHKCRQKESIRSQQAVIRPSDDQKSRAIISKVQEKRSDKRYEVSERAGTSTHERQEQQQRCYFCDRPRHPRNTCPARAARCNKCKKIGHYEKVCRLSRINEIIENQETDSDVYLSTVNLGSKQDRWRIKIKVLQQEIDFKIDSGADVTVVPWEETTIEMRNELRTTDRQLFTADTTRLKVKGRFLADLQTTRRQTKQWIYVVQELREPLLGKPAIEALDLISIVAEVINKEDPKDRYVKLFPKLFKGLGTLKTEYNIELEEGAKPVSIPIPRSVPLPLVDRVGKELKTMERDGIIERIEEPTPWCSGMVVVPKANGKIRICVDLTNLNKSVKRGKLIMPSAEYTLGKLGNSKVFTRLDANSGFWQIKLTKESAKLTTFITPFGRFFFKRLPFGITSAPEFFQNQMSTILEGLEGVICQMDDILIHANTYEEHDKRLNEVLGRLLRAGLTLNDKCEFRRTTIKFLGHVIDQEGIRPDQERIKAIMQMKDPTNVEEVRRFLGMLNHIGTFIPNLSEKSKAIRDLLKKQNTFIWGAEQKQTYGDLKKEIEKITYMKAYNPKHETIVSADSSSYGLGGVLLQVDEKKNLRPVAFASKSLNETESRYAQIEKEAYAITFACERFDKFLVGKKFHIETDHKPLVPLLGSKDLNSLPARIQRFKMRLFRYNYTISHVPGKSLATADTLSRAPLPETRRVGTDEVELYAVQLIKTIPASNDCRKRILQEQRKDPTLQEVLQYIQTGWPRKKESVPETLKQYYAERHALTIQDNLIVKDNRIVIPKGMRREMISKIHQGHQGINRCMSRVRESVWWPGVNMEIKDRVENCEACIKERPERRAPMIASKLPSLPWEKVGIDLMEFQQENYLVVMDYYSRYLEVVHLRNISSSEVIGHCKAIFARHGIPEVVVSDSGTQFLSGAWQEFSDTYEFSSRTSSPYHHQSNGQAESGVRIVKKLFQKSEDKWLALLAYRSTPGVSGYSPAELLMGRKLKTPLPMLKRKLHPKLPTYKTFREKDNLEKNRQKKEYDRRHRVRKEEAFKEGDKVWVRDKERRAVVKQDAGLPRSYVVETDQGRLRRNVIHLSRLPNSQTNEAREQGNIREEVPAEEILKKHEEPQEAESLLVEKKPEEARKVEPYRTKSGREVRTPVRYREDRA